MNGCGKAEPQRSLRVSPHLRSAMLALDAGRVPKLGAYWADAVERSLGGRNTRKLQRSEAKVSGTAEGRRRNMEIVTDRSQDGREYIHASLVVLLSDAAASTDIDLGTAAQVARVWNVKDDCLDQLPNSR